MNLVLLGTEILAYIRKDFIRNTRVDINNQWNSKWKQKKVSFFVFIGVPILLHGESSMGIRLGWQLNTVLVVNDFSKFHWMAFPLSHHVWFVHFLCAWSHYYCSCLFFWKKKNKQFCLSSAACHHKEQNHTQISLLWRLLTTKVFS